VLLSAVNMRTPRYALADPANHASVIEITGLAGFGHLGRCKSHGILTGRAPAAISLWIV